MFVSDGFMYTFLIPYVMISLGSTVLFYLLSLNQVPLSLMVILSAYAIAYLAVMASVVDEPQTVVVVEQPPCRGQCGRHKNNSSV